jgi:gamma-glutamyl:cysteine ligase YbdK (ATP-grasp superfamily)
MKFLSILSTAAIAIALNACSPSIDMPKGSSKGYKSARIVKRTPNSTIVLTSKEKQIHREIHNSIKKQFTSHGKSFNDANADLVIGYLVIAQNNAMTTSYSEYFGYGRDANEITDIAHLKGVIKGVRPDFFERAGLLVDVIDAKTNKLVYRNYYIGDIVNGASGAGRAKRIDSAVAQALAPFFSK